MVLPIDLFFLVLRVFAGLLIAGHGAQKVFGAFEGPGLEGFRTNVSKLGFAPRPFAELAAFGELVGGLAVALGVLTPIAAAVLCVDMLVAITKVHAPKGLWVTKGGYEFALTLFVVFALFGLAGPGAIAIDPRFELGRAILAWSVPLFAVTFLLGALVVFAAPQRRVAVPEKKRDEPAA
jgi:putative oxidoreductase